jgi:hypothetical protein
MTSVFGLVLRYTDARSRAGSDEEKKDFVLAMSRRVLYYAGIIIALVYLCLL